MDKFSHYYNPLPLQCELPFWQSTEIIESTSVSDGDSGGRTHYCDEDVMLASSHPKKRAGRKKFRETRHPVFRGIRQRNSGKWVCEVREPNKKSRIWLGTFPTAEMAARAHDVAAIALRGRSVCLNFADSMWRLPVPASADSKDIQKAAAEAAEAFRPQYKGVSRDDVMEKSNVFDMDEDALFDMPGLLANMAEGLILPPPPPHCEGDSLSGDGVEDAVEIDVCLWSYSI